MSEEVNSVIDRGKFSILVSDKKEQAKEDTLHVNEINLQKGLRLTSTPDGIFLHITTSDKTRTAKLDPDASDPLVISLYEWAQKLVDDRTYNH
ncbi:hypothetical protein KAR91_51265 [Candidatus Pacearchaeota archaeon]|nr:hypothetical protein [Candidatus Pacearchaeota archaeon]